MHGTIILVGSDESARRLQAVALVDPTTGAPTTVSVDTTGLASDVNMDRAADALESIRDSTATAPVRVVSAEYETVAASQTDQMMGPTGAIGDTIEAILVIPSSTTVGAISIEDGATNTTVYAGGTVSADLKPFVIPLYSIASVSGGWEITTGAGCSLIVFGNFT